MTKDDKLLQERGILYVPDFLVNRMGIVNCADEHMGVIDDDPKSELHLGKSWSNSVFNLTLQVLEKSDELKKTTQEIAIEIAEARSFEPNPCYGHRSLQIVQWLVKNKWESASFH